MKKYFLLIVMSFAALGVMAQTTTVATLTHAGVTTEYYDENAFILAVKASVDGDLITLSEGLFKGPTINKSLNIRGNGVGSTQITSEVILDKSADENEENHWLNIEGITFNADIKIKEPSSSEGLYVLKNLCMNRCDIKKFGFNGRYRQATLKNCSFINCRITNEIALYNVCEVSFINSIVSGYSYNSGEENRPKVNMLNCVVISSGMPSRTSPFNAKNSVLLFNDGEGYMYTWYIFPPTVSFQNCVISGSLYTGNVSHFFDNGVEHDKTIWMPMADVFATTLTNNTSYDATNDYQLKEITSEEVDGTKLGIYNGEVPFTTTVTYPHFTTFNVAEKAVDGKLSVEVATE